MQKETHLNPGLKKLKSVLGLAVKGNFTILIGCVAVWVIIKKNAPESGLGSVLPFVPIFMGDAINHYVLSRIRLESDNNWHDICVAESGKLSAAKNFVLHRVLSIVPSYLLSALMLSAFLGGEAIKNGLKAAFCVMFFINLFHALFFIKWHIAPCMPAFGGKSLVSRGIIAAAVFMLWFAYMSQKIKLQIEGGFIFGSGLVYLFLCVLIHPLPAHYSFLKRSTRQTPALSLGEM